MFGTDFPFVTQQQENYNGTVDLVTSWLAPEDVEADMGGAAQKVFGPWGVCIGTTAEK